MTTPAARTAMKVPGRISAQLSGDAYDFTTAYPHGGTALGLVREVRWVRREFNGYVRAEDFGGAVVGARYRGEQHLMLLALRGWDTDALTLLAPYVATDDDGGPGMVYSQDSAEHWRDDDAVPVLFTPDDTDNHRCVLFRSAIPLLVDTIDQPAGVNEVQLGRGPDAEHLLRAVFLAQRTGTVATGAGVQVRLLSDLVLP